ncbi:MAG: ParB family transcriptional regulator, chromosome partitioning protein [Acidimicrobiaceae bacterium]|nr:ParB family transcriptional regulator, chromosome partitioning protein [Acidimicrobiaceae bacterium]
MTTPLPRPKRKKKGEGGGSGTLRADREKAGLTGGQDIHALPPEDGELLELDPETISPNPMNMRLELRDMDAMIADVGERGVHTPGIVMHTKVFMECYPQWASRVKHPDRTFILGPGHRRHAAALATGRVMPAVLRDDLARHRRVEEELVSENNSRAGLSPIEQALAIDLLRQRVHEDEDRALSFDEVVERAGYAAGTVSKYLALLKLPQDVQQAIHIGGLSMRAGYSLSLLKDADGKKESPEAHALQLRGWQLMRDEKLSVEAAKNRVTLEGQQQFHAGKSPAAPMAVPEPREESSAQAREDQAPSGETPKSVTPPSEGGETAAAPAAVAVIETADGAAPPAPAVDPEVLRKAAADQRDLACRLLLTEERFAKGAESNARLVTVVLNPNEWKQAAAKAHGWLVELKKGPSSKKRPTDYFAAVAASEDSGLMHRAAFAIGLAADEVRAAQPDRAWDARDVAHVQFLATSRASYQLSEWEQQQVELLSRGKQ